VMLMRDFGMRFQEAAKFRPEENIQGNRIDIVYGTKGGRDRDFEFQYEKDLGERRQFDINERQRETIQQLNQYLERQNVVSLSRMFEKYKNFENNTRNEYKKAGITKEGVGTPHGLRHAYAQERYKDLTGWKPPAQLTDEERRTFRGSMSKEARELDRSVRLEISHELGHGRTQVSSNYIGSWRS
jgi:integrase